jgi:hypothetical protein
MDDAANAADSSAFSVNQRTGGDQQFGLSMLDIRASELGESAFWRAAPNRRG